MKKRIIAAVLMTSVLLCSCSNDSESRRERRNKDKEETEVEETEVETSVTTAIVTDKETEYTLPEITETIGTDLYGDFTLDEPYASVVTEIEEAIYQENLDVLDRNMGIEEIYFIGGQDSALYDIGVALYDFNNDSVPELFIIDTLSNHILCMYTIGDDGETVQLLSGASRNCYTLLEGMRIHNCASSGWAYTNIFYLTTAPDGVSLEPYDAYFSSDSRFADAPEADPGTVYWYKAAGATCYEDLGANAVYIGTEIGDEIIFPSSGVIYLDTQPIGSFPVG